MAGIRAARGHNEWLVTEGHRQGIGKSFHHDYDQAVGLQKELWLQDDQSLNFLMNDFRSPNISFHRIIQQLSVGGLNIYLKNMFCLGSTIYELRDHLSLVL